MYNAFSNDQDAGVEIEGEFDQSVHRNLHYVNHALRCKQCHKYTHWKCGCGIGLCSVGISDTMARGPCYYNHIREIISEELGVIDAT